MRKANCRTCFEEEEGSVIFCGSNHKNSLPSPAVPPRAPRRDFPNTLGPTFNCGLVCQLSVPEFSDVLGLFTEEFKEENELHALTRHIHFFPSKCWHTLAAGAASYNLSRSKASVLPSSLRYLHAILAHTITGRQENTSVVNIHNAYFLWCMSHGHIIDLAYFSALAI
ncbi:hypothetical protein PVK06_040194 [Gossypium arboreum]|uniref:Uncharacterized protein n=1 Tax=Gossypium arboreum TaxID=29729 RepID=A0ABR0N5K6_GOSAR|nr:hypothetical protein PVK06_040194 [Gossypium arboreum]